MPKLQPCIHDALNFCGIEHVSCQIFAGAVNFTQLVLQQHCWSWIASYQCYKVGQQLLYTRCTDVQESYPLKLFVAGQIIQLSNMHINDCQSSSQVFRAKCHCANISTSACNGVKLVPSLTHILQACQGLNGVCLFLTQASWCVMPASMGLVELLSCKMYARRVQDNNPENRQNRQLQSKLPALRLRIHAKHPPAGGSFVVMRQYHFSTACCTCPTLEAAGPIGTLLTKRSKHCTG